VHRPDPLSESNGQYSNYLIKITYQLIANLTMFAIKDSLIVTSTKANNLNREEDKGKGSDICTAPHLRK